ncbi:MAG: site-specific DNA-methyltransferase, partial [Atribacterota bacterium]
DFLEIIKEKIGMKESLPGFRDDILIIERKGEKLELPPVDYTPRIQNAKPQIDPKKFNFKGNRLYKVIEIVDENTIKLDTGLTVKFLGVRINKKEDTIRYLRDYILGKNVFLSFHDNEVINENTVMAYVYLKNKIFVNAYLIKSGLAVPDFSVDHKYKGKFV